MSIEHQLQHFGKSRSNQHFFGTCPKCWELPNGKTFFIDTDEDQLEHHKITLPRRMEAVGIQ